MRAVLVLLFITGLSGCNFINSVRLLNANDSLEPVWLYKEEIATVNSHYIGEQLFIEASINGQEGYRFLIDTGASIPCLMTTEKVKQLSLVKEYEVEIGGNGNESDSPAFATQIKQVDFGPVRFNNMTFCVVPLETTQYYLRQDEALFDGVIGVQLFDHYPIQINPETNEMVVFKNEYQPHAEDSHVVLESSWGKYYIQAEIELTSDSYQPVEMIVDSGSRNYIKLNKSMLKSLNTSTPRVTAADFGLSGRNVHERALIPGIKVGNQEAKQIRANFIHDDDDDDITYILGNAFLNHFIVTFDVKNESMYFRHGTQLEKLSKFNLIGLQLRKTQSGLFVVRNIIPQLPAARLDFEEGDLISSIGGVPAVDMSLSDWITRSSLEESIEICRIRKSDERCFNTVPSLWFK
ncbi:aspartyl protease family protein [Pleionea sediminis]|uniref:aspartyl protease family protein n=1 Tax=Pleionea sediminis TaxID=2569479 RepID=UPI0013DDAD1D|nr:aspartyl protease family protein [Pleionea sediminis]